MGGQGPFLSLSKTLYFSLSPKVLPSEKQTSECQPRLDSFLSFCISSVLFFPSSFLSRCCCVDVTCEYQRTKWAPCKQPKMRTAVPFVRVTGYVLHSRLKKVKSLGRFRRDANFQTLAVFCCYGFLNSKRKNGFTDSFRLGQQVKRNAPKLEDIFRSEWITGVVSWTVQGKGVAT